MVFALFAPYIQAHFRLDQAATNTVVVGGQIGCYLSAGATGLFADRFGPRWCVGPCPPCAVPIAYAAR